MELGLLYGVQGLRWGLGLFTLVVGKKFSLVRG
jgi:hypothetical protein